MSLASETMNVKTRVELLQPGLVLLRVGVLILIMLLGDRLGATY